MKSHIFMIFFWILVVFRKDNLLHIWICRSPDSEKPFFIERRNGSQIGSGPSSAAGHRSGNRLTLARTFASGDDPDLRITRSNPSWRKIVPQRALKRQISSKFHSKMCKSDCSLLTLLQSVIGTLLRLILRQTITKKAFCWKKHF